ncbi:TnsD family Tn7-like transposition protein [Paenibacillus lautus]|uniref:TnsD family Tn7-like transposition protein n=1 Tax=Paenibacillus lautus TaxID=1401 RepID=UPI001C11C43F|nr:TnsD family Tn7-like transposition protein [Paenibacillus lautus]MBU5349134.1 TnsD family transposase [Paenibacillus lautus]
MLRVRPYPDELVYSLCSRIHFLNGNETERKTKNQLFGNVEKTIHVLWPTRLEYFSRNYNVGLNAKELCTKHTLFPYYAGFLSDEKRRRLFDAMRFGNSRANPSAYLGLNQEKSYVARLYLCPLCAKEDISKYGEPYWHRTHHLPGSKVCYKHNVWLLTECPVCSDPFTNGTNQELNITPMYCNNGHSLEFITENNNEDLLLIAQENNFLLTSERQLSLEDIHGKFHDYAKAKGYQNVESTVILYEKLFPDFIRRFPVSFLDLIGVSTQGGAIRGINKIFRKRETPIHPLYVLLLILFFGGSIENFMSQGIRYTPFGEGPWPCLNKLCSKFTKKAIGTVELKNTRRFAKPRGVFKCTDCGFTYSRLGPDKNQEDIYQYDLIPQTGELWDAQFEEQINNDIIYLSEMAKELGVGTVFLRLRLKERLGEINLHRTRMLAVKQLQRNRISEIVRDTPGITLTEISKIDPRLIKWMQEYDVEWLRDNVKYTRGKLSLDDRRKGLLEILQQHPKATRKELKQIHPSNYEWLIIHDKQWMMKQLPPRSNRNSKRTVEERREKFLKLLIKHPLATRSELKVLDSSNYTWLKLHDNEWFSFKLPPIKIRTEKKNRVTFTQRRDDFLLLRKENPHLSRGGLQRLNSNNYTWLRTHDSEWFEQHLPPPIERKGLKYPRYTLEERRNQFIIVYRENPQATPKEIRKLCGSNYTWLHTHDFLWLKEYQPGIRKTLNNQRRKRTLNKSLEQRRDEFLAIRNEHPRLSRTGLKEKYQSLYVWLMTNDTEWLLSHLPPIAPRKRK